MNENLVMWPRSDTGSLVRFISLLREKFISLTVPMNLKLEICDLRIISTKLHSGALSFTHSISQQVFKINKQVEENSCGSYTNQLKVKCDMCVKHKFYACHTRTDADMHGCPACPFMSVTTELRDVTTVSYSCRSNYSNCSAH